MVLVQSQGRTSEVPAHHNAEAYLDAYIEAAGIAGGRKGLLFRSAKAKTGTLTDKPLLRNNESVHSAGSLRR
jgi:hypothetical protein